LIVVVIVEGSVLKISRAGQPVADGRMDECASGLRFKEAKAFWLLLSFFSINPIVRVV